METLKFHVSGSEVLQKLVLLARLRSPDDAIKSILGHHQEKGQEGRAKQMRGELRDEAQELAHDVKYTLSGTCAIHGTSHGTDISRQD